MNNRRVPEVVVGALMVVLFLAGCAVFKAPGPTATLVPLQIISFTASHQQVREGDPFTLTWETIGAEEVSLNHLGWKGTIIMDPPVPLSGSLVVAPGDVTMYGLDAYYYTLGASNGVDDMVATLAVKIVCDQIWLVPNPPTTGGCPQEAFTGEIVAQDFYGGIMLWTKSKPDYNIHALCMGKWTGWRFYTSDSWEPGMPESDPEIIPPSGYYQPVRNLGKAWREMNIAGAAYHEYPSSARECLGWATGPEYTFDGFYQCQKEGVNYGSCFVIGPDNKVYWLYYSPPPGWKIWTGPTQSP
jgi:hypothetical protein